MKEKLTLLALLTFVGFYNQGWHSPVYAIFRWFSA